MENRKKIAGLLIILLIYFIRQFLLFKKGILLNEEGFRLFVYWNIEQGSILYKDIYFHSGIISPYFYGLIFKLFGTELLYVRIAAIVLGGVCIIGLYAIALELMPVVWAAIGSFFAFHLFYMPFYEYGYLCSIPWNYFALYFIYRFVKDNYELKFLLLSIFFGALSCLHNMYQEGAAINVSIVLALGYVLLIKKELKQNYKYLIYYSLGVIIIYILFYSYLLITVPFDKLLNGLFSFLRGRYPNPVSQFWIPNIFDIISYFPKNISLASLYLFAKRSYHLILIHFPYVTFVIGLILTLRFRKKNIYLSFLIFLLAIFSILSSIRLILWYATGSSDAFNLAPSIFLMVYFVYILLNHLKEKISQRYLRILYAFCILLTVGGYTILLVPNLNPKMGEMTLEVDGLKGIKVPKEYKELVYDAPELMKKYLNEGEKYCSLESKDYLGYLAKRNNIFADDLFIFLPFRQYGIKYIIPEEGYFPENKKIILDTLNEKKPKVILTETRYMENISQSFPELIEYIQSNYDYVASFGKFDIEKYQEYWYEYEIMEVNFYILKDLN